MAVDMTAGVPQAGLGGRDLEENGMAEVCKGTVETTSNIVSPKRRQWAVGMLNERGTTNVPGSVLLLCNGSATELSQASGNASISEPENSESGVEKKRTSCGKFVLEPQPSESPNDPLNWALWRRDAALLSLGFYCMLGGGMTPILAAGFNQIAAEFHTTDASVALTTGLYAMGLGLGSVILSPTAILFGKRPVYLAAALVFMLTSAWCALSTNLSTLIVARIFMGLAVSSVECLPSATIAEIFFLHEKAYRLGIYTLLLLSGKNLVPLVSAVIIESLGWRWVFWIVCLLVCFAWCLLFLLVHETSFDRTRRALNGGRGFPSARNLFNPWHHGSSVSKDHIADSAETITPLPDVQCSSKEKHVLTSVESCGTLEKEVKLGCQEHGHAATELSEKEIQPIPTEKMPPSNTDTRVSVELARPAKTYSTEQNVHLGQRDSAPEAGSLPAASHSPYGAEGSSLTPDAESLREESAKTFVQQLSVCHGRLKKDSWFRVAARPFILFAYPAVIWSAMVYALSIGWLIVLSESMSSIYENKESYNFNALQTGLIYISPFLAGILGTVVSGKASDAMVRRFARRNGGVYEPEFRLVMIIPVAFTTTIGLMGFGWSAAERDLWIVPAIFFGLISFGCSLGATTAITFAVDSYRQFAGEALVTLNFSKNIFHGMVFSLFFNRWLEADGSKITFVAIGSLQFALLLTTIPMYIFGKRARQWVAGMDLMAKL